jgi:hypothetical protein
MSVQASSKTSSIQGFLHGYLATGNTNGQVLDMMIAGRPAVIREVVAAAQGGGTTTVLDVLNNGVSVWTNPASRPTLSGAASGRFVGGRINHSAVHLGDVLEIIVAQAGNKTQITATVPLEEP